MLELFDDISLIAIVIDSISVDNTSLTRKSISHTLSSSVFV